MFLKRTYLLIDIVNKYASAFALEVDLYIDFNLPQTTFGSRSSTKCDRQVYWILRRIGLRNASLRG